MVFIFFLSFLKYHFSCVPMVVSLHRFFEVVESKPKEKDQENGKDLGGLAYTQGRPKSSKRKDMTNEDFKAIKDLLAEVQGSPKEVLTTDEAAAYLGVSKSCLYKLTMSRKIPYYKSEGGKLCYFDRQELIEWMKGHRVATSNELTARAQAIIRKGGCA